MHINLKLNFTYILMAYYRIDSSQGLVLIYKDGPKPEYISYGVDNDGNCFWGNYNAGSCAVEAHKNFQIRCVSC